MKKSILTLIIISLFTIRSFAQQRADALVLYRNGKYAEAIKICEQEIVEDPQNIDSYCVLCSFLFDGIFFHFFCVEKLLKTA